MNAIYRIMGKRGRITIPYETRLQVGFSYNDILSFVPGPDGKSVVVKRERICDNCASGTGGSPPNKSQDIENASGVEDENDGISLQELLDSLTPEQQKAALAYLNMKWLLPQNQSSLSRH